MPCCQDCHKSFSSCSSYKYHITHQVCHKKTQSNHSCSECGKIFSTKQMFNYHTSHQVCRKLTTENNEKINLKLKSNYNQLSKEELLIRLSQMEGKVEALTEYPQIINNNNNNNNNNNILIFPKEFGKEDINYIQQKIGDILKPMITQHPFKSIPILFNKMHNNEQLPEYHNIYVNNERSNYAMVSDGHNFEYKPKKNIIDQIIEDKRSILNQYVDDNGKQLGEKVLSKYEKYQDQIDGNSTFRKDLELEIGGLLLNMKSVIANDEKTRQMLEKVDNGDLELNEPQKQI